MTMQQQTMANGVDQGVGPLVRGIVTDMQELIASQFNLLKSELSSDMRKTREAAFLLGLGVAICCVGGGLLSLALVFLMHWLTLPANADPASLPLWACFTLVGLVVSGFGASLAWLGRQKFASFSPLPDQTAAAIKETLEWKTNPK